MSTTSIPREPNHALLRPFIGCSPQELPEAWAVMFRIAEVQHARAGSAGIAPSNAWQVVENMGTHGHAPGFYAFREGDGGNEWLKDKKRRIACFATHAQAVAAIAAAAPQAPAAPTSDADRELLAQAAKAAGYKVHSKDGRAPGIYIVIDGRTTHWNPLHDDGDVFRLAVALNIVVSQCPNTAQAGYGRPRRYLHVTLKTAGGDRLATTRRAIVSAAAKNGGAA